MKEGSQTPSTHPSSPQPLLLHLILYQYQKHFSFPSTKLFHCLLTRTDPILCFFRFPFQLPKHFIDFSTHHLASSLIAVKLHLRSTSFEFRRALNDIGCRQLKYFYAVYNWTEGQHGDALLALTRVTKRSRINIQSRKFFAQLLKKDMAHPNIDEPLDVQVLPDSTAVAITRRVYPKGSLRDHIYGATYHDTFVGKYYKLTPRPFDETTISSIGAQILNALVHLQVLGIPYTHLSAGNVMLTSSGIARLTETENSLLKTERFYEHIFREFSATHPAAFLLADINVLAFGCVLYEMSTALPVHQLADLDNLALGLPVLSELIRSIFHADGKDTLVPTLTELQAHPFFANAKIPKKAKRDASSSSTAESTSKSNKTWSVTESDIIKDALKTNGKLIYPDDEKLYFATATSSAVANSPDKFSQLGGFVVQPKPNKVKKGRQSVHQSVRPSSPSNSITGTTPTSLSTSPSPYLIGSPSAVPPRAPAAAPSPPPPPPPRASTPSSTGSSGSGKGALLSSIASFNSSGLRKTETNDRSKPAL